MRTPERLLCNAVVRFYTRGVRVSRRYKCSVSIVETPNLSPEQKLQTRDTRLLSAVSEHMQKTRDPRTVGQTHKMQRLGGVVGKNTLHSTSEAATLHSASDSGTQGPVSNLTMIGMASSDGGSTAFKHATNRRPPSNPATDQPTH